MLCIIYLLKNTINNKVYVGQTWNSLEERWASGYGYIKSKYLYNAICDYGDDKFYYEILTLCSTQEMADYWEDFFIKKFDSINRSKGFNLRNGGAHGKFSEESRKKMSEKLKGNKYSLGYKHTEESKKKMSESQKGKFVSEKTKAKLSKSLLGKNKGKICTEETKNKISNSLTGVKNHFYGKHHSEDAKQKMSNAKKGKKLSEEHKRKMSESRKGRIAWNKGKVTPLEVRLKISKGVKLAKGK